MAQLASCFSAAGKAFIFKSQSAEELIERSVQLADTARKGGFLALEEAEITNPFMQKGINMLVDGHDADVVRTTLEKDIELTYARHELYVGIWKQMGDLGPAMGMIGTLIGLVQMLSNMEDPKSIGPAMAVALLTTLYGAMMATMIFLPMADKLNLRMTEEARLNAMLIDAISAIQNGTNPRVIETLLTSYLPPAKRKSEGG